MNYSASSVPLQKLPGKYELYVEITSLFDLGERRMLSVHHTACSSSKLNRQHIQEGNHSMQELAAVAFDYQVTGRYAVCNSGWTGVVPADLVVTPAKEIEFQALNDGTYSVIIKAMIDDKTAVSFDIAFYMYDLLTHLKNGAILRIREDSTEVDITDIGKLLKNLRTQWVKDGMVADPENGGYEAVLWYLNLPDTPVCGWNMADDVYYFKSPVFTTTDSSVASES